MAQVSAQQRLPLPAENPAGSFLPVAVWLIPVLGYSQHSHMFVPEIALAVALRASVRMHHVGHPGREEAHGICA